MNACVPTLPTPTTLRGDVDDLESFEQVSTVVL